MMRLTHILTCAESGQARPVATLTLPLASRIKSRLRVTLDDGREAGLFLERGLCLRDGDLLASPEGLTVRVRAAPENLSVASCPDPLLLARACYHLGNRHVPLAIAEGRLCYQHDHVLDAMLRGLGLAVGHEEGPFEPEPGAYAGSGGGPDLALDHAHAQGDGHSHGHGHAHRHGAGHDQGQVQGQGPGDRAGESASQGQAHDQGHGHRHAPPLNHKADPTPDPLATPAGRADEPDPGRPASA
jgi:urease accessory protein